MVAGRTFIVSLLLAGMIPLISAAGQAEELPFSVVTYPTGGIREPENMTGFSRMGFDGFYYNGYWEWEDPEMIEEWCVPFSLACAENNMSFIAGLYWYWVRGEEFDYSLAVNQFGEAAKTMPSPVSEGWWKHMMEDPAVYVANLSLHYPIWGIVWDTEFYGPDAFERGYYSYDQEAIGNFANDTQTDIPSLDANRGREWLEQNGLLEEFQSWQEHKSYLLAKGVAEKVHRINPDFTLGLFPLFEDWWQMALLKGFGTYTPAAAWTGWNTYDGISRYYAQKLQSELEERDINFTFAGGIGRWIPLSRKETAVRYCDASWWYGTTPSWAKEGNKVVREYIYLNQTHADMLAPISFGPDVYAHPYRAPDGIVSVMMAPYEDGKTLFDDFRLLTDRQTIRIPEEYGLNPDSPGKEPLESPDPVIPAGDLPCLVYGMDEMELARTGLWYLTNELKNLTTFYSAAGLGNLSTVHEALAIAEATSDPRDAVDILMSARDEAYDLVLQRASYAIENPGNITVPPSAAGNLWIADLKISKGQLDKGRVYVYEGMHEWYMAGEGVMAPVVSTLLLVILALRSGIRRDSRICC